MEQTRRGKKSLRKALDKRTSGIMNVVCKKQQNDESDIIELIDAITSGQPATETEKTLMDKLRDFIYDITEVDIVDDTVLLSKN